MLRIEVQLQLSHTSNDVDVQIMLFENAGAGAICVSELNQNVANPLILRLLHELTPGGITEQTYDTRAGSNTAGTLELNNDAARYNTLLNSFMLIEEIQL